MEKLKADRYITQKIQRQETQILKVTTQDLLLLSEAKNAKFTKRNYISASKLREMYHQK